MTREHEPSELLFALTRDERLVSSFANTSDAKETRERFIKKLRKIIEQDGKYLISQDDYVAFSRHGSLYQRLCLDFPHDIDIYVALDGNGLSFNNQELAGQPYSKRNLRSFSLPLVANEAASWMYTMAKAVIRSYSHTNSFGNAFVECSKRGAKVTGFGSFDFDVIPSFLLKDPYMNGKEFCHVIPNGTKWEVNPTTFDMSMFQQLGDSYSRDTQNRILGFRDVVKMMKHCATELNWEEENNLTSFVIRCTVAKVFLEQKNQSVFNHKTIENVVKQLNNFIASEGMRDPYQNSWIPLTGKLIEAQDVLDVLLDCANSESDFW